MANFYLYFPQLLVFEGGYVDDPNDPGGATNKGITLRTFQAHAEQALGLAPTLGNLQELTDSQAAILYRALYWDALQCDQIQLQCLAEDLCDFYINAGVHAIFLVQRLLGGPVAVDGVFGHESLAALEASDQRALYARYRQGRIDYYRLLAAQHPVLTRFLAGWLRRAQWFPVSAP